ncbi:MAG: hypothetical protein EOM26_10495 [Alphaproteobacteria bacterium]|nr:hypothetical protein [Alphaproteobacteria bacterium]
MDTPRADIATLLRIAASGDDFDRDSVPPATQEREARKIIRAAISDIASNRLSVADAAYYVAPLATLLRTPDPLAQIYDTDFDSIAGWDSRIFMLALMAQFSPNRISEGQVVTFLDSLPKPPAGAPAETHLLLPGHGGNRSEMDRMARLAERYFGKEGRRDALPPLSPGIYAKASHSRDVLGALYGENAIATLALDTAKSMPINVRAFSTENRRQALKTLWHETAEAVCSASPSSATGVDLEAAARTRHNLGGNVLPDTEGLDGTALLTAIAVEAIIAAAPPTDFVEKSQDAPPHAGSTGADAGALQTPGNKRGHFPSSGNGLRKGSSYGYAGGCRSTLRCMDEVRTAGGNWNPEPRPRHTDTRLPTCGSLEPGTAVT